ncbi:hypothetical protein BASA81_006810 [Batrachochytrium salamandrivorans]|nr:hypothetical protein BASA81_006810 [Batrachochytrium salamandrivorans]
MWFALRPQPWRAYSKQLIAAKPRFDKNDRLGAQLFGEEEWSKQQKEAASNSGEFQFHNRRGRLPVELDQKLADRFGPVMVPKHEFLFGHHPVELALRFVDGNILSNAGCKLYIQDGSEEQKDGAVIKQLARNLKVPYEITSKMRLDEACKGESHQGVVLDLPKQEYSFLDSEQALGSDVLGDGKGQIILCLDEFQDPKTMGAVLRSALFFNVAAVIVSAKNSSQLDPALCKASAGASLVLNEQKRLFATHNIVRTLHSQRRKGWRVVTVSPLSPNKRRAPPSPSGLLLSVDELATSGENICLVVSDREGGDQVRSLVIEQCELLQQPS